MIAPESFVLSGVAVGLFAIGFACLIARKSVIKMVMGIEFCGKGICLLFLTGGYIAGDIAVSQAVVFTVIAIEAVVAALALALIILVKRVWKTFDAEVIFRSGGGES